VTCIIDTLSGHQHVEKRKTGFFTSNLFFSSSQTIFVLEKKTLPFSPTKWVNCGVVKGEPAAQIDLGAQMGSQTQLTSIHLSF
jgi:hypothetical protein